MFQILTIILGSGVVSAVATHFLTTRLAERNFRHEKLEQLYLAGRKYVENSDADADLFRRSGKRVPPSELADWTQRRKDHDQLHETCHMLTNLYFPQLFPALSTFEDNFARPVTMTSGSAEELQESGAHFVASIIIEAQRMNKPWYLTRKNWLRLPPDSV